MKTTKANIQEKSKVETQILKMFAEYYSESEIANKLNLDVKTIREVKQAAMQKYDLKNCLELRSFFRKNL